jgi:hypothetical protein
MMRHASGLAKHSIFYTLLLLVVINVGFALNYSVSKWDLFISYILYCLTLLIYKSIYTRKRLWLVLVTIVVMPFFVFGTAKLFGHTYDTSYDGQDYQQTAVISLARGWNPLRQSNFTIPAPTGHYGINDNFGKKYVLGYPKSLWLIQTSIYKLTGLINSGTVTNLYVGLIALPIVYEFLRRIKFSKKKTILLSLLIIIEPPFIQEFLTYMSDGFSYVISVIAIISLTTLFLASKKRQPLALFLSCIILMLGSKYSNLFGGGLLGVFCVSFLIYKRYITVRRIKHLDSIFIAYITKGFIKVKTKGKRGFEISSPHSKKNQIYAKKFFFVRRNLYRNQKYLNRTFISFVVLGLIVLYVPYITNTVNYKYPFYPDNQSFAKSDITQQNIPNNIKHDDRVVQLFYGIYSKPQNALLAGDPNSKANVAQLKIPFTFTDAQIDQSGTFLNRIATNGVLFSGLITMSLLLLLCIYLRRYNRRTKPILIYAFIVILMTLVAAIADPSPDKLIYTPEIALIPIYTVIVIDLIYRSDKFSPMKLFSVLLTILILFNVASIVYPVVSARIKETNNLNSLLSTMSSNGKTYEVYAANFYSIYTLLQQHNIHFVEVKKFTCKSPQLFEYSSASTYYCPS